MTPTPEELTVAVRLLEEVVDRQDDAILALETLVFEQEAANARLMCRVDELVSILDEEGIDI